LFEDISAQSISEDVGITILQNIEKRRAAIKLSEVAYQISTGNKDINAAQEYIDVLTGKQKSSALELTPLDTNLEQLLSDVYQRPGLRWRLNFLNRSLGSLRAGDFGFIFARPETGKTTFLASEVSNFLTQTDQTICWFNNEEQGNKVLLRIYQAFFGCRLEQLIANVKRYQAEFIEATGGRFRFYDSATLSRTQIERIVSELNPRLVVYDQIDKIKGFNADREDLRLGAIYQWSRELAKNRHSVIAVCQAGGTAENVKYLQMDHVANALTAKQAEADYIIGIGKIHDMGSEYVRYLNIPKNKLMGDSDSDPMMKHAKGEVLIEPLTARYKDIVDYGRKKA
jgi:replicative DNA helicase